MLNLNFQKTSHNRLLMFLNIKEMSRALCFDNSITNNALFGRQAYCFIENFDLKKLQKEYKIFFSLIKSKENKKTLFLKEC